jgi:hypothetical protein
MLVGEHTKEMEGRLTILTPIPKTTVHLTFVWSLAKLTVAKLKTAVSVGAAGTVPVGEDNGRQVFT